MDELDLVLREEKHNRAGIVKGSLDRCHEDGQHLFMARYNPDQSVRLFSGAARGPLKGPIAIQLSSCQV